MDNIQIEASYETPGVLLDAEKGFIEFSGKSFPENVSVFYDPLIKWIEEYMQNPKPSTLVNFKFEYFNTASSKKVLDILLLLKEGIDNGKNVKVEWYFDADDEEMEHAGVEYADIAEIPITTIPFTP